MKKSFVGEQLMARLKALRLPQGLLARVRWIFLLVGSIATVSTVPAVFAATEPWPLRVAALVGILWLFWHWVRGYRRGGFSRAWGAIEGLAVLVIGLALDTPLHVLGVVYNGLVFRSLYGDRRDVAVALLSYLGAFLGAVALSLMVTGPSIPLSELVPHVLGLTLLPLVFHFLKITITKHEQAMVREKVLREAGASLVATQDRESVYATALEAALELTKASSQVRVGLTTGSSEEMFLVASAGFRAAEIRGNPFNIRNLPEPFRTRFLGKQPIEVEHIEDGEIQKNLGLSSKDRPFFAIPLFVEEEIRGVLGVTSESPLPAEVKDGLEALGFQVALALESVAFAEDRHWRQSEVRFRVLIQNSSDIVMVLGADGTINYISPPVRRILGYAPEDLIGKGNFTLLHPDDAARVRRFHEANVSIAGARPALEARLRHLDGSWRHFEGVGNNLLDDPNVGGIVINLRDVTERKQAEKALRQSEERLRRLVEQAAEAFFVHNLEGRFVEVNQQACDSLGYTKEELLSMSVADIEENFDAQGLAEMWERIVSNGPVTVEGTHRRKDGTRFPVEVRVGLFETGADRLILAMARDITERKRTEEALRNSEALNRTIVDTASDGIITMSEGGLIRSFNRAAEDIFGYNSDEVIGRPLRVLMPERFRVPHEVGFRRYLETGEAHIVGKAPVEFVGLRKDGSEFPLELSLGEMREGEELLFTGVVRDITDRKRIEDTLRANEASLAEAQRIASLGSWEIDLITGEMHWSDEMYRIFGFAPGEVTPTREVLIKAIHPQDREVVSETIRSAVEKRQPFNIDHRVLWPDGEVRVIQAQGEAVFDLSGRPSKLTGTSLDITERKQAEEEVRRSESRLLAAQRIAHVGDWSFDVDGNEAHWSDEMYRIFGLSSQEETLTYKRFLRLVHPDDRATVRGMSREALKGGGQSSIDYRVIRPDGRVRFVHSQYEIKHDASGETTELVGTLQDVTELRQAEEELRRSEERFRALVQNSLDVVSVIDANATVLYYSPSVEAVMGYKPEEFIGKNALEVVPIHPDDLSHVRDVFSYLVANPGVNCSMEMRLMHANGSWRTVEATANNLLGDPSVGGIVTNYRDITERKRSEKELRKSEATNRAILEATPDLMFVVSRDGEYLDFRANADSKLYASRKEIIGSNLRDTMPPDLIAPMLHHITKTLDTGEMQVFEYELPTNDEVLDFEARLVVSGEGEVLSIIRNVTERKVLERRLEHQAFHDALTGLPNRALFVDRLEHALIRASRPQESVAVLFLDLDNFKVINDSLGHTAGDKLLVAVTERLLTVLRPEDTLARLGGDEFTILIEGVESNSDVFDIADRVAEALRAPFILEGREVFVTVSIGIALGSSYQDQPGALLRNADLAMYRAKETGKARFEVFDSLMNERALERLRLESELRRALDRNEFRVYYQPTVLFETGKVIGVEALVRWEHPERGLLAPVAFIPLAEETGLIVPIGEWVLEEACRQAKEWQDQRMADPSLTVSVNLSARKFRHPLLFKEISGVLESSGIEAGTLILEITETVMMEGDEYLIDQLRELKASGIKLAIDDFGTGYSSLFYLSRFPVDYLKIDRSFVDDLGEKPEARKLIGGIIDLASSLDLRVIAEGIETSEQLEELRAIGCEIGQGYYFAHPLPARDIPPLL